MPEWLAFEDFARLKRMRAGGLQVLGFRSEAEAKRRALNLRALLAHWNPMHHWSIRASGRNVVVRKLESWENTGKSDL